MHSLVAFRSRIPGSVGLVATGLLLLFTACSPKSGAAATTINLTGADYAFTSDKVQVPAGKVHFVFSNRSTASQHELWVYPQTQPKLQDMVRAKESGQDVNEEENLQNVAGDAEDVPIGQTQSFDVTLSPGTYEFGCFITSTVDGQERNHYSLGMHTLLTVVAG